MKTLLTFAIILFSFTAQAQTDSLDATKYKVKTSLSLQARDWLYLNSFMANSAEFENVYDSVKIKIRAANTPALTTVIKVDSIRQGQIIRFAQILKQGSYGIVAMPYSRINTALKANAYLTSKIDAIDADYISAYNAKVQDEIIKLRSVLD